MTIIIERVLVSEIADGRTPLILVSGWNGRTPDAARSLLRDGTVVVHHDLDLVHEGVVRRTVTTLESGAPRERLGIRELAHGCISCTLREDLLPLLRRLHAPSSVQRIVLHLDRRLEPEAVCWAVEHVSVSGVVGQLDGPASRDVRIDGVVTCLDAPAGSRPASTPSWPGSRPARRSSGTPTGSTSSGCCCAFPSTRGAANRCTPTRHCCAGSRLCPPTAG
jgi:hypothetical protein